jgi:F0F1-type ATP synthase alpha subunit
MAQWQTDMIAFMEASYPEIVRDIAEKKAISDANRASLLKALDAFRSSWLQA